jgi:hypothetical protein
MKFCLLPLVIAAALAGAASSLHAGERATLTVSGGSSGFTDSASITLGQGDSLDLIYSNTVSSGLYLVVTIGGKELAMPTLVSGPHGTIANPVKIAGPATVKARIGPFTPVQTGLITVDVTRAGLASPPAAIPMEAGATYQVILEASTDLVNWTAVSPGDYAAASPQRFFRTRMVKKP